MKYKIGNACFMIFPGLFPVALFLNPFAAMLTIIVGGTILFFCYSFHRA